jgi:transglutaminase-like putative cysteine protease
VVPVAEERDVQRPMVQVEVPAFMLGAAMLLWGWHQSLFIYAVLAAVAIECSRNVRFRWELDDSDFQRLGDVSGIDLLLLVVVEFADRGMTGIYGVLRWFPMVVLGLALAQTYSTRSVTPLSAMFLSVRIALKRGRIAKPGNLDMRLPLLVVCLLSACGGLERSAWVLPLESVLLLWLLLVNCAPRRSAVSVVAALVVCALVVLLMATSVRTTREALGPLFMDILRERMAHWRDPFRNHTALGEIGRLKLSDRIVMRVESPPGIAVPRLLHEATYTHLNNSVWLAGASPFSELTPSADGTRWDLSQERRPFGIVTIAKSLINNKALLAVPPGAFRIEDLPVEEVHANSLGALKVKTGPALVRYRVRYEPGAGIRSAPTEHDRAVPKHLRDLLARKLTKLQIAVRLDPRQDLAIASTTASAQESVRIVGTLLRHFNDAYRYTLDLTARSDRLRPIEYFLEHSYAGHCEFFATATVLLLRAAGIPARYATGFAVQEYSPLEQAWIIRRRHSHSWAVAWVNEQWVAVDTTPPQWVDAEAQGTAWWQSIYDTLSWLWHRFSRWRLEATGEETDTNVLLWGLLSLVSFLAWRITKSRRVKRSSQAQTRDAQHASAVLRGVDSEFYRVEQMLHDHGLSRPRHCSVRAWLMQLAKQGRLPRGSQRWEELVALHYRLRFAPRGLSREERQQLAQGVAHWLQAAQESSLGSPSR